MKMNSRALIMVLAVFNGTAALACNPNNPMDLSCPTGIFPQSDVRLRLVLREQWAGALGAAPKLRASQPAYAA